MVKAMPQLLYPGNDPFYVCKFRRQMINLPTEPSAPWLVVQYFISRISSDAVSRNVLTSLRELGFRRTGCWFRKTCTLCQQDYITTKFNLILSMCIICTWSINFLECIANIINLTKRNKFRPKTYEELLKLRFVVKKALTVNSTVLSDVTSCPLWSDVM